MSIAEAPTKKNGPGFLIGLGIFLNVFIPKGGFYLAGIPLTWGYLFLVPTVTWGFFSIFFAGRITLARLIAFACCIPFLFVAAIVMATNGVDEPSFAISLFVSFGFLPLALYVALDNQLPREKIEQSLRFSSAGFVYVAILGIALFILAFYLKSTVDVPFITTGGGGELDVGDRNNLRGNIFKLTSTFNNGNIYGVCALMMLPLIAHFESRWKTNLVKLSILLTLSRTAWAGLIFYELGHAIFIKQRKGVLKSLLVIGGLVGAVFLILLYLLGRDTEFLFSSDLGGRISTFEDIGTIYPFSVQSYDYIREIVYPSVLAKFGYIGLATFFLAMLAPFGVRRMREESLSALDKVLSFAMTMYLVLCCSDGAILYIPVLFFYWALATSLLAPRTEKQLEPVTADINSPTVH